MYLPGKKIFVFTNFYQFSELFGYKHYKHPFTAENVLYFTVVNPLRPSKIFKNDFVKHSSFFSVASMAKKKKFYRLDTNSFWPNESCPEVGLLDT
jgi:hypothetical protein